MKANGDGHNRFTGDKKGHSSAAAPLTRKPKPWEDEWLSRSLDSQIKANLTGVLCFAMVNDASSINVLGNGKAKVIQLFPSTCSQNVPISNPESKEGVVSN